jgi:uncharacterized cupin superfamily protein
MVSGNLYDDRWDDGHSDAGETRRRLLARELGSELLGASVYGLEPGATGVPYHLHHANEELLVVVSGTPTVRTPDGERELRPGDVTVFIRGAAGAHQVINRSAEPCRFLIVSTMVHPEIAEFPDTGKIGVFAGKATGAAGEFTLVGFLRGDARMGFWEGEPKP